MGTNYYLDGGPPSPDHPDWNPEGLHIGKSCVGWVFTFRAYPNLDAAVTTT
jgi:hypothetical protein